MQPIHIKKCENGYIISTDPPLPHGYSTYYVAVDFAKAMCVVAELLSDPPAATTD